MKTKIELSEIDLRFAVEDYLREKGIEATKVTFRATENRMWNDQATGTFSITAFAETEQ